MQIPDNPELLNRMMSDMEKADALYKPTQYWKRYQGTCINYLKEHGLTDCRQKENTILETFGAVERTFGLQDDNLKRATVYFISKVMFRFPDIKKCFTTEYGNPKGMFFVTDTSPYTLSHLQYIAMVADAHQYIKFNDNL